MLMYEEMVKRLQDFAAGTMRDADAQLAFDAVNVIEKMSKLADAIPHVCECCVGCELEKKNGGCDNAFVLSPKRAMQYLIKPRWIPVTEALPEQRINQNTLDFEYVLCATTFGDVRPFKYGRRIGQGDAHFWNGAGYVDAYVTHWQPLPEPPKEEA